MSSQWGPDRRPVLPDWPPVLIARFDASLLVALVARHMEVAGLPAYLSPENRGVAEHAAELLLNALRAP